MLTTNLEPVSKEKLISELTPDKLLRLTSKGGNEIYSLDICKSYNAIIEIGRLREISYRANGCGSGNIIDIDNYDIVPPVYNQLIVWNPREKEIVGGYRYAICSEYSEHAERLAMRHYFRFSENFREQYLPYCMELGRAWINPEYQPSAGNRKSIFALDNLWDGIGAVLNKCKHVKYLYGKLTIPENYNASARILLHWLLIHYFKDTKNLVIPEKQVVSPNVLSISGINLSGISFETDFKVISQFVRSKGNAIPPLLSAYIGLARTITIFGTTVTPELNNAYETGMMIKVEDIYPEKLDRYMNQSTNKKCMAG